jgi:hypothetical protein
VAFIALWFTALALRLRGAAESDAAAPTGT